MWRSATLAMVMSSTSMKVAIDTTQAISQGLRSPAAERGRYDRVGAIMAGHGTRPPPPCHGRAPHRHGRACPGHLRFDGGGWMAGTCPAMTESTRPESVRRGHDTG